VRLESLVTDPWEITTRGREEEQRKNEGNGAVRTTIETVTTFTEDRRSDGKKRLIESAMAERKWKKEKETMRVG
jgi:hypothetical protein